MREFSNRKKCGSVARRRLPGTPKICADSIVSALQQFPDCVSYLNTRRGRGPSMRLKSESDIQDAVYLLLRGWVHDLIPECPGSRKASRYTIIDFVAEKAKTAIEAKFIRNKRHGTRISQEMHDDIEMYRHHEYCDTLIFFVYDPDGYIPDKTQLREQIEDVRHYENSNRTLRCVLIIAS